MWLRLNVDSGHPFERVSFLISPWRVTCLIRKLLTLKLMECHTLYFSRLGYLLLNNAQSTFLLESFLVQLS